MNAGRRLHWSFDCGTLTVVCMLNWMWLLNWLRSELQSWLGNWLNDWLYNKTMKQQNKTSCWLLSDIYQCVNVYQKMRARQLYIHSSSTAEHANMSCWLCCILLLFKVQRTYRNDLFIDKLCADFMKLIKRIFLTLMK